MKIKAGPAGIGPVKEVEETFKRYKELGIEAAEVPFTYGVYIKEKSVALKVAKAAERFDIKLSVHAPYWINLNSKEKSKIKQSKQRILRSCEVASWLNAERVIFHPGYYGSSLSKRDLGEKFIRSKAYQNIKKEILEMMKEIKKNKWNVKLCPETTGKINVFGSIDEISCLAKETRCSFCIDFAHIFARYKSYEFELLKKSFSQKEWHCHFSGIEYGEKGEKNHKETEEEKIKELIANLRKYAKNKEITIINEAPEPVKDTIKTLKFV